MRTQTFQVIRNRIRFKCPFCGSRRHISIPRSRVRRKEICCHKCNEMIRGTLNRREIPRESHSGKVTMQTKRGDNIEVSIRDKSDGGAGFDVNNITDLHRYRISIGQEVRFICNWNRSLFANSRFEIVDIHGQRIGVKKLV